MENNAPGSNLVAVGYLRQPCVFIYQSTLCTLSCDDLLVCTARLITYVVISGWVVYARCMLQELRKHRLDHNVARWVVPVGAG